MGSINQQEARSIKRSSLIDDIDSIIISGITSSGGGSGGGGEDVNNNLILGAGEDIPSGSFVSIGADNLIYVGSYNDNRLVIGYVAVGGLLGQELEVQTTGILTLDTSLTYNSEYYIGLSGNLALWGVSVGNTYIQRVGRAVSATQLLINLGQKYLVV